VLPTDAATYGQLINLASNVDSRFAIVDQRLNVTAGPAVAAGTTIVASPGGASNYFRTNTAGPASSATGSHAIAIGSAALGSGTGVASGVNLTDVATFGQLQRAATAGRSGEEVRDNVLKY
jgi:hypothetical protein